MGAIDMTINNPLIIGAIILASLGLSLLVFLRFKKRFLAKISLMIAAKPANVRLSNVNNLVDEVKLKDVMREKVISIHVDEPFSNVPKKFKEYGIRHLPVIDHDHKLVGLLTQRMMYKIRSPRKLMEGEWYYDEEMLNDVILKHVMIQDVYTLTPDNSLRKALMKLVYSKYGSIPIIDNDGKLVSIVTRGDILKFFANLCEQPKMDV